MKRRRRRRPDPVLVVGSVALDTVVTPAGAVADALGGSAVYFSCACRLFAPVRMVGIVGRDFPEEHLRLLNRLGADLSGLERCGGPTFRWTGSYLNDLNEAQTLAVHLNVMAGYVPKVPDACRSSRFVFLANTDPDVQLAVLDCLKKPAFVACDTINHWIATKPEGVAELIRRTDALIVNDGEARLLTGGKNLIAAGKELLRRGPKVIIIKKGEHGAILLTERSFFAIPAYPVESVVDPTGAGDSFAGGFMGYLAATGDTSLPALRRAVACGAVVASFTVEGFSVNCLCSLTQKDVAKRLRFLRQSCGF